MSRLQSAAPIWSEGSPRVAELMTRSAATMLARRIEAYWRQRGGNVKCRIETVQGERIDGHGAMHCIRSDMVGGMPR